MGSEVLFFWLSCNEEEVWGKDALSPSFNQIFGSFRKKLASFPRTRWSDFESFKSIDHLVGEPSSNSGKSEIGKCELAVQSSPPRSWISVVWNSEIFFFNDFKSTIFQDLNGFHRCVHWRKSVSFFDFVDNFFVLLVVGIVFIGHTPLIVSKVTARLEDSEDFFVDVFFDWTMLGSLKGIDMIEMVV